MSQIKVKATQFGYVKKTSYTSWNASGAYQGMYKGSYPRVGVMLFGDLHSVDWSSQIISKITAKLTFAQAGTDGEKTISLYRGAKSSISGTGESMIGAKIGDFKTGGDAYKSMLTIEFSAGKNASVFSGLVAWLQSMTTNTLTIYRNETAGSSWSTNYLQITAAELTIDYEPAGSGGTLNKDSIDAGETVTLTIEPFDAEGAVTHGVEWTFGSHTSGLTDIADALTASFTYPLGWLDAIPNAVSGTAYCRLTTYVDGVEKAVRPIPITLTVPEDIVPDFDVLVEPVGTEGGYWQHLSSAQISILDARAFYGATIKSYRITGAEGFTSSLPVAQTPVFALHGDHAYTVTVTDSRGRSAQMHPTPYVYALAEPQINAFSVQRYAAKIDDSGDTIYTENLSGGHVWFNIDASIDLAGYNNTPTAYIMYGPAGGELRNRADIAWASDQASLVTTDDRTILTADIPLNSAFEFRLYVEDEVSRVSWPGRVEKSSSIMHFAGTGYGVSIGGFSGGTIADKRFDVAPEWTSHFPGGLYGYGDCRMDRAEKSELLTFESGFAAYNERLTPRISRVGAQVYLQGFVRNTADLESGFQLTVTTLPEWARPGTDASFLNQGSGEAFFWLRVNTDGTVVIMRYRKGSSYVDADAGSQFPLTACWLAKDAFVQTYSVSATTVRCTSDNTAVTVREGSAYVARLTPDPGTKITSIIIAMGGADASGYYENGVIHIPIVTGNIEIYAAAEIVSGQEVLTSVADEKLIIAELVAGAFESTITGEKLTISKYSGANIRVDGERLIIE